MSDTTASEMREVFNSFDANGDGTIDAAELANILRSLGYNPSQDQAEEMVRQVTRATAASFEIVLFCF